MSCLKPEYSALRVADLVAKLSKNSLKDTIRIMLALDLVSFHLDQNFEEILYAEAFTSARPGPDQVAACELAHAELLTTIHGDKEMKQCLDQLKQFL